MATPRSLWLVRHGQASFGKADYDKLSDLGHEQARLLGEWLGQGVWRPTRLVCGSMRRHRETIAEVAVAGGLEADVEIDARLNEIDHVAIIQAYKPAYRNMLVLKADMARTLRPQAAFVEMFEAAIQRWSGGEHDADYAETFSQFSERVSAVLTDLAGEPAEQTLVVSSLGVIATIAAGLIGGGDETMRSLSLAGYNTGVTRLLVDKQTPHLVTFNEIGHLREDRLITQR